MVDMYSINNTDYSSLQNSIKLLAAQKTFKTDSAVSDSYMTDAIKENTANSTEDAKNKPLEKDILNNSLSIKGSDSKKEDEKAEDEKLTIAYGSDDSDEEYYYTTKKGMVTKSFEALAAETGAVGNKISKTQLLMYLETLTFDRASIADNSQEIALVKNLIARFDTLSNGEKYITSLNGIDEVQDYTTVTPEQVTPPFNIAV